mgnify:CR=1 FL=1
MKEYFVLFFKGVALGSANVIPGVSGGTIALITGIFERLINAIKSFNIKAIKLLFSGKIKSFTQHTDLYFLIAVFAGVGIAIISLAKLFDFLFTNYPVFIWAYFFGLILASVFFVGKTIDKWPTAVIISLIAGIAAAVLISVMNPATENDGFLYLIICGIVAVCSMILPGLSGSFVLILMGNYQLVMIDAINNMAFDILFPVLIGAVIGLLGFSYLLSWIFKKWRNQTIALLTGFIFGSLGILWPWKEAVYLTGDDGKLLLKNGEAIITNYQRYLPDSINTEVIIAILLMVAGILSIWLMEKTAANNEAG